jgi:RNA polymerase-binding transcription factor DksA
MTDYLQTKLAFVRIEINRYGNCSNRGDAIANARLAVLLSAIK